MSMKIEARALSDAMKKAASIVDGKSTMPILNHVWLNASDGALDLTTSNLEIEYRQRIRAEVTAPFDICIDARRLLAMASVAKDTLTIEPKDGHVIVKTGRSKWTAPSLPSQDFPTLEVGKLCEPMTIGGKLLSSIISRVLWVAPVDAARYYLSGIHMNAEDGKARFVTTDGKALACIDTDISWPEAPDIIIPVAMCSAIAIACDESEAFLSWDDRKLRMDIGDIVITGKNVDGPFPDYRRILPEPVEPYSVATDDYRDAVRRVRIASDAKERRLRITRKDGALLVQIDGTAGFDGSEDIPADCTEGFEMGMNAEYLVSMLTAIECETVAIEHKGPSDVMRLTSTKQTAGLFTGLIMPMRV